MNKIKWLIVGTGDIAAKRIMPAIAAEPHSEIAAVCDIVRERAEQAAAEHNAKAYTQLSEALRHRNVDAVYVATPVFLHVPQAVDALHAGKHVLVEKPVGLNYRQAKQLMDAAEQSDRRCGVAYFRRFCPKYRMAEEMIEANEFGQIVLIRMTYFSWFNPSRDDPKYWRVVPERSGGGPVSDMGTHMFDVLIGLLGLPQGITAKAKTLTHDYGVEDSCVATFTMPDGAPGIASFNWNSKTWSHEFEIIGTEAKVKWHPYDGPSVLKTVGRDIEELSMPNHDNVHYPLIEDFVGAVLENRPPRVSIVEAAKTNRLVDALYRSSAETREVAIAEIT